MSEQCKNMELGVKVPPNELVQYFDIFLDLIYLDWFLRIEYRKRRHWSAIVEVTASWLDEASNKDDFEEGFCIFEEFELGTCLD